MMKADGLFGKTTLNEEVSHVQKNAEGPCLDGRRAIARSFGIRSGSGGGTGQREDGRRSSKNSSIEVVFSGYNSVISVQPKSFNRMKSNFGWQLSIRDKSTTCVRSLSDAQSIGDSTGGRSFLARAMRNVFDQPSPDRGFRRDEFSLDFRGDQQASAQTDESSAYVGMNSKNVPEASQGPDAEQEEEFERLMDEGGALLKGGEEGLDGRVEVGVAERMLKEAADLFASATAIDPLSLAAIEGWGNTLLVHGQLKLLLSEELQVIDSGAVLGLEPAAAERLLQRICEECEELLVEAGRKYRKALSIDGEDVRALYNWGLALCYRGQLLAAEEQENAAQDADKVFMAAIDKFETMMSINKKYAPGALLNWGLALQDRSLLRPMGSNERVKLLEQARLVFQEALEYDPDYVQAKMAVADCTVELKELKEYDEIQSEKSQRRRAEKWRDWN